METAHGRAIGKSDPGKTVADSVRLSIDPLVETTEPSGSTVSYLYKTAADSGRLPLQNPVETVEQWRRNRGRTDMTAAPKFDKTIKISFITPAHRRKRIDQKMSFAKLTPSPIIFKVSTLD